MSRLTDIFKKKLDEREFGFSGDAWRDLEKKLDSTAQKRSTGIAGKLTLLLLPVLITLTGLLFFLVNDNENTVSISTQINTEHFISDGEKTQNKETSASENNLSDNIGETTNQPLQEAESNPGNSGLNEKSIQVSGNEKTRELKSFSAEPDTKKNVSPENSIINESPFAGANNEIGRKMVESVSGDSQEIPEQKNVISVSNNNEGKGILLNGDKDIEMAALVNINEEEKKQLGVDMIKMMTIFPLLPVSDDFPENLNSSKSHPAEQPSYFMGAYAGLLYADKILKTTDTNLVEYISRRNNEEAAIFTGNAGIDFGIGQDCWNVSIGINYHQQGEITAYKPEFYQWIKKTSSEWNISDESYWKPDTSITGSYLVSEGSWQQVADSIVYWNNSLQAVDTQIVSTNQYVVDTTYYQYIYKVDSALVADYDSTESIKVDSSRTLVNDPSNAGEKIYTKISYFEFPILVGYEYPISRFTLMFRTGFSIGMLSKVNAVYMKSDISGTERIDISRMNKTMLNYLLHLGLNYYLTENTVINISPMFRINVNSALKDIHYNQRYWNAGINAGLMYRF